MINNIKTEIDNELNEENQKDYEIINNNLNTITETTKKINEIKVLKLKNNISYFEKFKKKYHEYNIHRSKRENIYKTIGNLKIRKDLIFAIQL